MRIFGPPASLPGTARTDPLGLSKPVEICGPSGPANVLVMPALHTAHISSRLSQQLGGGTVIGPADERLGLGHAELAALAAYDGIEDEPDSMPQAAE